MKIDEDMDPGRKFEPPPPHLQARVDAGYDWADLHEASDETWPNDADVSMLRKLLVSVLIALVLGGTGWLIWGR